MISGLVILYAWGVLLLVAAGLLAYLAFRFFIKARRYAKMQEDLVKVVEKRVREKHNAIATLPPKEFGEFLTTAFAKMLELKCSSQISEVDHEAEEKLYSEALAALYKYLGEETVAAIDYYYGKDYIYRWGENAYALLSKRGITQQIIKNDMRYEAAAKNMQ